MGPPDELIRTDYSGEEIKDALYPGREIRINGDIVTIDSLHGVVHIPDGASGRYRLFLESSEYVELTVVYWMDHTQTYRLSVVGGGFETVEEIELFPEENN